jgi:hypothetical protein
LSFICKRCNNESHKRTERELICVSCKDNLDLLDKQLNINSERIKKLEEHKKSVEPELKNPKSEIDRKRLLETMKRLDRNLQTEYKLRDGILEAINSKVET